MKKLLKSILSLLIIVTLLSGCGKSADKEESSSETKENPVPVESQSKEGDGLSEIDNELSMFIEGEVDTTKTLTTLINVDGSPAFNGNPLDETAGCSWSVQPFMYDYLAFFSPYPERQFRTSLLESYTYEDKVMTMKLLPDLKWSDGTDLNADDVLTNYYCFVGRSTIWNYIETIEKIDNLTIRITFVTDSDLVLNLCFNNAIMTPDEIYGVWADQYKELAENNRIFNEDLMAYQFDEEATEKAAAINADFLNFKPKPEDAVCSGPYVIETWNTSEVLFTPNENYRKETRIKSIRGLRPGDSAGSFSSAILGNEYSIENGGLNTDMSMQIDSHFKDTMRKVYIPELSQIGYTFNFENYPLNIPEVRKAICMMLDYDSIINVAEPGSFKGDPKNTGVLPSLQEAYVDSDFLDTLTDYSYNPDEAARLLESIGWTYENGKWLDDKGESPVISIATINTWPSFMMTAEAMSSMLSEQGLNIDFKPMEFGVWNEFTKDDEDKMISCTFIGSGSSYAHPWECLNDLLVSNKRTGYVGGELKVGEQRILTLSDGSEVNVSEKLLELYSCKDKEEEKEIIKELMTIANDICSYISVIEKTAPLRIYDTSLCMADTELNEVQRNYYYYGAINNIVAKLLADDLIYFVK